MVCVILPEMSLLVYMYMTTGGQERLRGSEGGRGREGEGESEGGRDRRERKEGGERDKSKERWNTN